MNWEAVSAVLEAAVFLLLLVWFILDRRDKR
jgi:hypothetical protein